MERIKAAKEYAAKKHEKQVRKDGSPYINHPLAVADALAAKGYDEDYQITGLFHDLLEDTDAKEEEILKLGGERVLEAVILLTKKKGQPQREYINKILKNDIARAVKNEDRINNLEDAIKLDDMEFVGKYVENTKTFYKGMFSKELDQALKKLENKYRNGFTYVIDNSMPREIADLYRVDKTNKAWVYTKGDWVKCSTYYWSELKDDALVISREEAIKITNKRSADMLLH